MKWLRILAVMIVCIAAVAAFAYPFRRDPVGPLAGKALIGAEAEYPADIWIFRAAPR